MCRSLPRAASRKLQHQLGALAASRHLLDLQTQSKWQAQWQQRSWPHHLTSYAQVHQLLHACLLTCQNNLSNPGRN